MADALAIQAQTRTVRGKAENRRLRRLDSGIPGVVYGAEKEPQSITMRQNEIRKALENEAFFSQLIDLSVDGSKEQVVLKSIDRHPSRGDVMHIDFFRVSAKQELTMNIPLSFLNAEECPGVKAGGVVSHIMTDVEIKCLPADLPENIEIDLGSLELDQSVHLSQLTLPKGVVLTAFAQGQEEEQDQAVVSVHMPKIIEEPEEEEAPAEEAAGEEGAAESGEGESKAE